MSEPFDLLVIGGGPGGYVAALRARQLGLRTALIEASTLGGICLNWGCIPTKSLLKSSDLFRTLRKLHAFGIEHDGAFSVDFPALIARSRGISTTLAKGIQQLLAKNHVEVIKGWGRFSGKTKEGWHEISVSSEGDSSQKKPSSETRLAKKVILATGARPRTLFPPELGVWSSREAMTPQSQPTSLLIIGAGVIGLEFASFYRALGTEVSVVEMASMLLPHEDQEIAAALQKELEGQGIRFFFNHTVSQLTKEASGAFQAQLQHKTTLQHSSWEGQQVLVAIGVMGNIENLGLEQTRVRTEKGYILTHGFGQTDDPTIYAIGDVAGPPWLAHKASYEGVLCVEALAGHSPLPLDVSSIPGCIYTYPQVASVGLTQREAEKNHAIKVGKFSFSANGQALALGEPHGFVKTIFDQTTGELLGAHMIGPGVSELIQGMVIAKTLQATEEDLKRVIFPHPTLSEVLGEAILDADGIALHKISKKT